MSREALLEQARQIARVALEAYDLPAAGLTPLRCGNNAVFRVEPRGAAAAACVLRVHRPGYRQVEHIRSELQFVEMLATMEGLRVPRPVLAGDGALVMTVMTGDGEVRHCDLLTWLDGHVRRPGRGLGPRSTYRLGVLIARMHDASARWTAPAGFELPRWDGDGLFTAASPFAPGPLEAIFSPADHMLVEQVEQEVRTLFAELDRLPGSFGVIHADFILGNCLFRAREPGVLDFDDCGWGYFLYDLCPLLGNLRDSPDYRRLRTAFLDGYRAVHPLDPALETHIDLLIAARHITSCLWVAGAHRSGGLGPEPAAHIAYRMGEVRALLKG